MFVAALVGLALQMVPSLSQPTAPWQLDRTPISCTLVRAFDVEGKRLTIEISPRLSNTSYEVNIVGKAADLPKIAPGTAPTRISLTDTAAEDSFAFTRDTIDGRRAIRSGLSTKAVDTVAPDGPLAITNRAFSARLAMPGAGKAFTALKTCHSDMLRGWNLDPNLWFSGHMANLGNPGQFYGNDSYPPAARARRISGRVIMLLNIDARGAITDCRVVESPDASLSQATCDIALAKMKPSPAIGEDGKPIASYRFLPVDWSL